MVTVIAALVLYWVYSHSVISISVSNASGNVSYYLINNSNGKSIKLVGGKSAKMTVSRGTYQVVASSGDKNLFSIVNTKSFLRSINISGSLVNEKQRVFVGDSPESCMNVVNQKLVSYTCGDYYGNINIHQPANSSVPTYVVKPVNAGASGQTEGIFSYNNSEYAVIYGSSSEDSPPEHKVFQINPSFGLSGGQLLQGTSSQSIYKASASQGKISLFDTTGSKLLIYDSFSVPPGTVDFGIPAQGMSYGSSDYNNGRFIAVYSNFGKDVEQSNAKSMVDYYSSNKKQVFTVNEGYSKALICGDEDICLINEKGLDVFSVSGSKLKKIHSIYGVRDVLYQNGKLIVATGYSLVSLSDYSSGAVEYSYGDYKFESLSKADSGYLSVVRSPKGLRSALLVGSVENTDSVDKKVLAIAKIPQVTFVSANGRFIYVNLDAGGLVYNPATRGFEHDKAKVEAAKASVSSQLSNIGLDQNLYTVVYTVQ